MRRSGGVSPVVYGTMLLERGEFGRAGTLFERSLKAAGPPQGIEEEKAAAWLQAAAECAAVRGGRGGRGAASRYDPKLLDVSARMFVLLCTNRIAEAKGALMAALDDEEERADALRWVQPFADSPAQSDFRKEMNGRIRALQRDPEVIQAVGRYGILLDWPLTAAVPSPTKLAAGSKAPAPWQCGDEASWQPVTGPDSLRLPDSEP